jgi:hypothetical protein
VGASVHSAARTPGTLLAARLTPVADVPNSKGWGYLSLVSSLIHAR